MDHLTTLVDDLVARRSAERVGERVRFLVEEPDEDAWLGRAAHQGPETDGSTTLLGLDRATPGVLGWGSVTSADGVDLVVEVEQR